jgi:hypothetical protein
MAIDDRVRERLQRSMSGIDVETERALLDARYRGHRRILIRRMLAAVAVLATIAAVAVMAPRVLDSTWDKGYQPATPPAPTADAGSESILGTWRSEYKCEEFVQAFQRAGIGELAARWLVNDGIQLGPAHRLAKRADLCQGAEHFQRTHIFQPNGYLQTYQGDKLTDSCRCYRLIDGHTFVVPEPKRWPNIVLQYRIDAGTLVFDAMMPDPCSSVQCRGRYAWAVANYAIGPWLRVI